LLQTTSGGHRTFGKGTEDLHMDDCPCTPGIKFIAHLPIWT